MGLNEWGEHRGDKPGQELDGIKMMEHSETLCDQDCSEGSLGQS